MERSIAKNNANDDIDVGDIDDTVAVHVTVNIQLATDDGIDNQVDVADVDGAVVGGFASNGYGEHSPEHYSFLACAVTEVLLTAFFLIIIHGATDKRAPVGFAPVAIGLGLTLIHLISIPVTNTSVNPARSIAVALFAEPWALEQVWFFIVFPVIGGVLGGLVYRYLLESKN